MEVVDEVSRYAGWQTLGGRPLSPDGAVNRAARTIGTRGLTRIGAVALALACTACAPPGEQGRGRGIVVISGGTGGPVEWDDACVYNRLTRWSSSLPHEIRLARPGGTLAVEMHFRHRPRPGATAVDTDARPPQETGLSFWLRDGGSVRARAVGDVRVREASGGFVIEVAMAVLPQGARRDTLRITASCTIATPARR